MFGIEDTPDVQRFQKTGSNQVEVYNMLNLYNKVIIKEEKVRIEKIEMMDEFEEWNLIQNHYCFGIALKTSDSNYEGLRNAMKLDKL